MATATTIFPQKPASSKRSTLPQHLWPKSDRHDIDNVRRRVKTLRRLASLAAQNQEGALSDTSCHTALWREVSSPLPLRTDLFPLPRDLAFLVLLHPEDLVAEDDTTLSMIQT